MNCQVAQSRLSEYLDDWLRIKEKEKLAAHLAACEECAAELDALRAAVGALHSLPMERMPAAAAERLRQRLGISEPAIATEQGKRSWLPRWLTSPLIPAAATALILLAVLVVTFNGPRTQTALKVPTAKAPVIAGSPKIIAAFKSELNGEGVAAEEAAEQQQSDLSTDKQKSIPQKDLAEQEQLSRRRLPMLAVSNSNYNEKDIKNLLVSSYGKPADTYQEQVKQLTDAAGRYNTELKRTLEVARRQSPESMPVYAELAFYQNEAAWIIILLEKSDKKALVIAK